MVEQVFRGLLLLIMKERKNLLGEQDQGLAVYHGLGTGVTAVCATCLLTGSC